MPLNTSTGLTTTPKLFVALNAGNPPAVTTVVNTLLVPACAASGVHVITPFVGLITGGFVPLTVLVSTYVSTGVGTAASVAVFVTMSVFNGLITRFVCAGSTGGGFVGVGVDNSINR